jgi:hypothetical protein
LSLKQEGFPLHQVLPRRRRRKQKLISTHLNATAHRLSNIIFICLELVTI